jgi:hypothetical protein
LIAAMESFVAKHAARIRGTLGCFDRVLFRGYLPLMSGWAMAEFLRSKRIERFTLKPFLLEQAERIESILKKRRPTSCGGCRLRRDLALPHPQGLSRALSARYGSR